MEHRLEAAEELPARAGYAAWAACYDDDGNPLLALEDPVMRGLFGRVRGERVLDLGCGTGRHTLLLARAGARVTALDQSPEMMAHAVRKLRGFDVAWLLHTLPAPLPFSGDTFELVVLGLVAEHVACLPDVFAQIRRVLRPGGRLLLSTFHPDRTAEGMRARFIDPATGLRRPITTYHRSLDDYRSAGTSAGMELIAEQTLVVPPALVERLPRAAPYVGLALGWVACWTKLARV